MTGGKRVNVEDLRSARPAVLFIDDGGVLNDNGRRAPEWARLLGAFMAPRLGGTAEQWATANHDVFPAIWRDMVRRMPQFHTHAEFQRAYVTAWSNSMCDRIGVVPPPAEQALTLYMELSVYIAERADAAIAGARDAVLALRRAGYTLYTASGTTSWELRGIVKKMGLDDVFAELYGPNIVDCVKYGAVYYAKIFEHASVRPSDVVVIDSDPECCGWAAEAGARALCVDTHGGGDAPSLESLLAYLT